MRAAIGDLQTAATGRSTLTCTPAISPTLAKSLDVRNVTLIPALYANIWNSIARPTYPKPTMGAWRMGNTLPKPGHLQQNGKTCPPLPPWPELHHLSLLKGPSPLRFATTRLWGHVFITHLTAVWTTLRIGHSPSWTLCWYSGAIIGPSLHNTRVHRRATVSIKDTGLLRLAHLSRRALLTAGIRVTVAWTLSR